MVWVERKAFCMVAKLLIDKLMYMAVDLQGIQMHARL